jgi:hypothetical protein
LTKRPSSSLGSHPGQRQGGCSGGGGPPASRPRLRTARGGKEGGRRGGLIPTLTLGRGGARMRLHRWQRTGGGGARGRRCSGAQSRGEGGRGGAWRPGERPAPFIGGGRRFGRGFFLSSGSFDGPAMAVERENIPPLTRPARPRPVFAVGVDAALWKGPDGQRDGGRAGRRGGLRWW